MPEKFEEKRYITRHQFGGDIEGIPVQRGDECGIVTAKTSDEQEKIEATAAFANGTLVELTDDTVQQGAALKVFQDMFTIGELRRIKVLPKEQKEQVKQNILQICNEYLGEDKKASEEKAKDTQEEVVSAKGYPTKAALKKMGVPELKDMYQTLQLPGYDNVDGEGDMKTAMNKTQLVDALDAHYREIEKIQK